MNYRFLSIILLVLALVLNITPAGTSPFVKMLGTAAFYAITPFEQGFAFTRNMLADSGLFFVRIYKANGRIIELENKVESLNAEIETLSSLNEENDRLRNALGFSQNASYRLVPANVIARDQKNWNAYLVIDAGENRGIYSGQTVISQKGLVGRVVASSKNSAKVMLILDPESAVSIMVLTGHTFGIARGGYGSKLNLEYIPEDVSVEVGSSVAVSSSSRSFIPGIIVGRVSKVERSFENIFQKIEVTPAADFSKLGVVFVCSH